MSAAPHSVCAGRRFTERRVRETGLGQACAGHAPDAQVATRGRTSASSRAPGRLRCRRRLQPRSSWQNRATLAGTEKMPWPRAAHLTRNYSCLPAPASLFEPRRPVRGKALTAWLLRGVLDSTGAAAHSPPEDVGRASCRDELK